MANTYYATLRMKFYNEYLRDKFVNAFDIGEQIAEGTVDAVTKEPQEKKGQ